MFPNFVHCMYLIFDSILLTRNFWGIPLRRNDIHTFKYTPRKQAFTPKHTRAPRKTQKLTFLPSQKHTHTLLITYADIHTQAQSTANIHFFERNAQRLATTHTVTYAANRII